MSGTIYPYTIAMQSDIIVVGVSRAFKTGALDGSRGAKRPHFVYYYRADGKFGRFRCSLIEAVRYRRLVQPIRTRYCKCGWKSKVAGKQDVQCPQCNQTVQFPSVK